MNFPVQVRVPLREFGKSAAPMTLNYAAARELAMRSALVREPPKTAEEAEWRRKLIEHSPEFLLRSGRCLDC